MAAATEVTVPDLGDFAEVPVIEIHVAAGDVVSAEDPLITLESDKATMDIPSPAAGTSASCGSRSVTWSAAGRRSCCWTPAAPTSSRRR